MTKKEKKAKEMMHALALDFMTKYDGAPFCIAAVDPGVNGAVSFIFKTPEYPVKIRFFPMLMKEGVVDTVAISKAVSIYKPSHVYIEEMFVGQGTSAVTIATMGKNWGRVAAAFECQGVKVEAVMPAAWQSKMLAKREYVGDTKARAKDAAKRFFPEENFIMPRCRTEHDGCLDVSLLNVYACVYALNEVSKSYIESQLKFIY